MKGPTVTLLTVLIVFTLFGMLACGKKTQTLIYYKTPPATPAPPAPPPATPTLEVLFYAEPNAGHAPLRVNFTVAIGGSATGPSVIKIDCINNGRWDKEIVTDSVFYRVEDLGFYPEPGEYRARVEVKREGIVVGGTTTIVVLAP